MFKRLPIWISLTSAIFLLACTSILPRDPSPQVTPITIPTSAPTADPSQQEIEPVAITAEPDNSTESEGGAATPAHIVPTPVLEEVPAGQALAIAYAQDLDITFELAQPAEFDEPVKITFDDFLVDYDPWANEPPELSPLLKALDGRMVELEGYMAPPLKLGLDWFQLTAVPVGSCAFCSGASDWTPDIALVYVEGADDGAEMLFTWAPLKVVGELHIGENVDIETGMVSLVRIYTDVDGMEEITFTQ